MIKKSSITTKIIRILTFGFTEQSFLGQPWIPLLLKITPKKYRKSLALRLLSISPHYFIYQWTARYPTSMSRAEILKTEYQRNARSRKEICRQILRPYLHPKMTVLDFGCGPGSFSLVAASIVGQAGKVHALDVHPLALQSVERKSAKGGLQNIETISSDGATGLPDQSMDFVILNDVFHEGDDPDAVLAELHRILKPEGVLFFSDHHMNDKDVMTKLMQKGLFRYSRNSYKAFLFSKS